jgi:hypothetical protein
MLTLSQALSKTPTCIEGFYSILTIEMEVDTTLGWVLLGLDSKQARTGLSQNTNNLRIIVGDTHTRPTKITICNQDTK